MFQYNKIGKLFEFIVSKKRQIKTTLYSPNQQQKKLAQGLNVRMLYSLYSTIINNLSQFKRSKQQFQQSLGCQINNEYLFYIMIGQAINVGKIKGGGKLKKMIMQNKSIWPKIEKKSKINKEYVQIRIRQQTKDFEYWRKIFLDPQTNARQAPIIKNMFTLQSEPYSLLISKHPQLLNNKTCVIQSFSSALPAFLVSSSIRQNSSNFYSFDIIDACSAPGNKTLQLSQYFGDQRKVFACEKSKKRVQILKNNMNKYQTKNVIIKNIDFLENNIFCQDFKNVKIILLDPSCSGSGMLVNFSRDEQSSKKDFEAKLRKMQFKEYCQQKFKNVSLEQKQRVINLRNFQISLLDYSAKLKPVRISYSTCSIYEEQNENVVRQFLLKHPDYEIKKNKQVEYSQKDGLKRGFGKGMQNCIRVDPRDRKSDGFFVCIFKRIVQ